MQSVSGFNTFYIGKENDIGMRLTNPIGRRHVQCNTHRKILRDFKAK